jgi:signal transduction histidine kinase
VLLTFALASIVYVRFDLGVMTPKGSIIIRMKRWIIRSQQIGAGQVLISISDVGGGLPVDKVDQIFNAFFSTKPHGTGVGLAISRSIIESHGSRLWATSHSGRGATFHFTMPNELQACT